MRNLFKKVFIIGIITSCQVSFAAHNNPQNTSPNDPIIFPFTNSTVNGNSVTTTFGPVYNDPDEGYVVPGPVVVQPDSSINQDTYVERVPDN